MAYANRVYLATFWFHFPDVFIYLFIYFPFGLCRAFYFIPFFTQQWAPFVENLTLFLKNEAKRLLIPSKMVLAYVYEHSSQPKIVTLDHVYYYKLYNASQHFFNRKATFFLTLFRLGCCCTPLNTIERFIYRGNLMGGYHGLAHNIPSEEFSSNERTNERTNEWMIINYIVRFIMFCHVSSSSFILFSFFYCVCGIFFIRCDCKQRFRFLSVSPFYRPNHHFFPSVSKFRHEWWMDEEKRRKKVFCFDLTLLLSF